MKKVVLVDDNQMDLLILQKFFEGTGVETVAFTHPSDALDEITKRGADLLVTDYDMLGMNGGELARAARAVASGLRVWCVTASVDETSADQVTRNCDTIFGKPLRYESFMRELRMTLA
jgi:CheY-like chemotaxis protein